MTVSRLSTIAEVTELVGQDLGPTDWEPVDQDTVDRFADVTGDHQWIHVDAERAAASPFGGTIAHGFLTLSLYPKLLPQLVDLGGFSFAVNYGLNRVRFPAPVKVGSRVRMSARIDEVKEVGGGAEVTITATFEGDQADKPVVVAQALARVYP